jgi:two-component sensor histidine kinase
MIGQPKSVLVPSEVIEDYRRQQREVAAGNNMRSETIRLHKNGTPIPVSVDAAPIRRPDGRVIATSSILHDITDRIANEEHRQFLMREITHRSKNQLAIIQSIATQTARASGTKQEFLDQFRNRLQGLSASHDLLLKQDWRGAPLDELIHRQLEVFVGNRSDAVTLQGPATMLTAAAAEAIGLAIHELATNSAKYGALSVPTGRVEVTWRQTTVDPDQQDGWEISWCELGGPKVTAPTSTGFGTQVIKRMVAVVVNGRAELDYPESGLVWRLTFPAPAMKLVDRAKENHADRAAAPSG